jgi:hypothetical protein
MPVVPSMTLPPPESWQEFESLVRDAMAQRWRSSNLTKHGRPGQAQDGVDIFGNDDLGRSIGIQCKLSKVPLKIETVIGEVRKAGAFQWPLATLYVATSAEHDANLQAQVRLLSEERVARGEFTVGLLFWDDIVSALLLDPRVFSAYYPQFMLTGLESTADRRERLVASLELGYYGAEIWKYISLIHGEAGWLAQEDPDQLLSTMDIIQRRARQLFAPEDVKDFLVCTDQLRQKLMRKCDWDGIEILAKRASARIQTCSSLLPFAESNVLDTGVILGRLVHCSGEVPLKMKESLKKQVLGMLSQHNSGGESVEQALKAMDRLDDYRWPIGVFNLIDRAIRYPNSI